MKIAVVPAATLREDVLAYAAKLAENAPLTLRALKASLVDLDSDPADRDRAGVQRLIDACFSSKDYQEGRNAFAEKRKPDFRGR